MRFLCDTNVVSEVMRRRGNERVVEWFEAQEIVRLSAISVEEIYWGLAYKDARRQRAWFERLLENRGEVLDVTESIARRCGILRGQFRRHGITRTQADTLIAATVLEHDLVLVTRNVSDFEDCGIPLFNPHG